MIVYLSVMLLCCIIFYATQNNKNKVTPIAVVFGMIWLMLALQEGWGGDYDSYEMYFDQLQGQSYKNLLVDDSHGEIGYKILMSFMPSVHTGFVICMAIWCFAMGFFFYHFVPQKMCFWAILFIFFDRAILMGMVASYPRMAIANAFLIFAVFCAYKDKRLLSVGLVILGSFFHRSVLFMLPLFLIKGKENKLSLPLVFGAFVAIDILTMISPQSWFSLVEGVIMGVDAFQEAYAIHFEEQAAVGVKGLILIVLFYWIYWLAKSTYKGDLKKNDYLMLYYALVRIAFDMLPSVGISTRFFYYIDIYFFAGMMCAIKNLPSQNYHKYGLILTLLLYFGYLGYWAYSKTPFFQLHWANYNFIF